RGVLRGGRHGRRVALPWRPRVEGAGVGGGRDGAPSASRCSAPPPVGEDGGCARSRPLWGEVLRWDAEDAEGAERESVASGSAAQAAGLEFFEAISPWDAVPDPRGTVAGHGDDACAVGAEGGGVYRAFVAAEDGEFIAGGGVPDPRGTVAGRGDDACAVGAEGGGEHPVCAAAQDGVFIAG